MTINTEDTAMTITISENSIQNQRQNTDSMVTSNITDVTRK